MCFVVLYNRSLTGSNLICPGLIPIKTGAYNSVWFFVDSSLILFPFFLLLTHILQSGSIHTRVASSPCRSENCGFCLLLFVSLDEVLWCLNHLMKECSNQSTTPFSVSLLCLSISLFLPRSCSLDRELYGCTSKLLTSHEPITIRENDQRK